jgi:hypothetical protein
MINIIKYIRECINPTDETELCIIDNFDENMFNLMKQDAIIILTNNINIIANDIDHVKINKYTLCRKNKPRQLAWLLENNTFNFDNTQLPIYRRLIPPPCETVNHAYIIANIIEETDGSEKNYIEYGVRNGDSIEVVSKKVKKSYGVDMTLYKNKLHNILMFTMTTDEFSLKYLPDINFDYAFIDADHSHKQVIIDFENILKYINSGGYIFLHDTYPCNEELLNPYFCNDCFLSPIIIKQKYPDIEILTLPLNPGLTIIRKNF